MLKVCDAVKRRWIVLLPASNGSQSVLDSERVPSLQSHSRLGQYNSAVSSAPPLSSALTTTRAGENTIVGVAFRLNDGFLTSLLLSSWAMTPTTDHEPSASTSASERVTGHSVHGQRIDSPSLPGKARLIGIVVPMPDPGNGLTSRTAPALGHNSYSMP